MLYFERKFFFYINKGKKRDYAQEGETNRDF